jgi:hypothetical protein
MTAKEKLLREILDLDEAEAERAHRYHRRTGRGDGRGCGPALPRIPLRMLVVDASLAVEPALDRVGETASADVDRGGELVAPPLLWS